MLEKILRLKNIARFHDEGYGSLSLGDFNLVFAENGCGKTTLSAIMHSIAKNEPGFIEERATVDRSGAPEAKILTENKEKLYFNSRSWSGPVENVKVSVFDSYFVNKNIYSGHTLSHDHKKRLHRFVIGERGQSLTNRIDRLDSLSRNLAGHIRDIEKAIGREVESSSVTVEEYLQLPEPDNLDEKIDAKKTVLDDLQEASEVQSKEELIQPTLPVVPSDELKNLLGTTLEEISQTAEEMVSEHVSNCMDEGREEWIEDGLSHMRDNKCPFCGRNLQGVDLIQAYRDYFSEEYTSLKSTVRSTLRKVTSEILPENGWRQVDLAFDKNQSRYEFWKDRIDSSHQVPTAVREQLEIIWDELRDALINLLENKKATPLERVEFGAEAQKALEAYESLRDRLDEYVETVSDLNKEIEEFKSQLDSGSPAEVQEEIDRLITCQSRHSETGEDLCKRLQLNRKRKERVAEAKEVAREKLDEYQTSLLSSCQQGVNDFLRRAGADFRIRDANVGYQGGNPNARFSIEINRKQIGIGNAVTEVGQQSFRNLLSEGDRNTLAFAFFYARVMEASDLGERTIVIDDPISSLDQHRRDATRNAILKLAKHARQVIVLSHSPQFLSSIWQEHDGDANPCLLRIKRTGEKTSELKDWHRTGLEQKVQDPYFRHFERLVAYRESREGDPERVANSIRHALEGNLRRRFPDRYGREDGSVGAFIGKVEDASGDNPLSELQDTKFLDELDAIRKSAYCHDPHHDDDPYLPETINERELATWVKRTLNILRGLPD